MSRTNYANVIHLNFLQSKVFWHEKLWRHFELISNQYAVQCQPKESYGASPGFHTILTSQSF